MSLLLSDAALSDRRLALADPLALGGLAASLQAELHGALDVPIPDGKSRLTRNGGRCVRCTVLLTFDPRSPRAHRCPSCGTVYTDAVHHDWWLMNGHLWTAEQCTRAASLAYLVGDTRAANRANDILTAYAARYLHWPNRDNALGPTRPFFSTYLESIWLLHLCVAIDLQCAATRQPHQVANDALDNIVQPSVRLIASFDEGRSNRQVWHVAAMLAAHGLIGGRALRDQAVASLLSLLETGLHSDGSWYEGENYHLFAHRGLLTAVTLAEQAGIEIPAPLLQRFEAGFAMPFRTMLPDGTFPARRDSQYGVALRQYRTADWVECGFARRDTPELRAALASMYAAWPDVGGTHRWSSSADAERNMPPVRLTRADCNWRALLLARPELPELADATPRSELLEGQGLAVFRRNAGKFWVGLDYGDPGDGHGHPDRLNLVIATQDARWLDDVGTGSYTSPTLVWYRSSMAHNAPMVNGRDQGPARGTLLAYDEREDAGWVSAEFVDPLSGVRFTRTVVVTGERVIDDVLWQSDTDVVVDVPMQAALIDNASLAWSEFAPGVEQDAFLTVPMAAEVAAGDVHRLRLLSLPSPASRGASAVGPEFACLVWTAGAATLWRAGTIGAPAGKAHGVTSLRQRGARGRSVRVFAAGALSGTIQGDLTKLTLELDNGAGSSITRQRKSFGWWIEHTVDGVRRATALNGFRDQESDVAKRAADVAAPATPMTHVQPNTYTVRELADRHYRGTETTWREAGSPRAEVGVVLQNGRDALIRVSVKVDLNRPASFAARADTNLLDNELPDVNSDGVQLHWRSAVAGVWNSVIAVPDADTVRLTTESGGQDGLRATWSAAERGFLLNFELPWPDHWPEFVFDLCVNEMPAGRERRRGQLVLSGAHGESAYLRGARQSDARAWHIVLSPDAIS